MAEVRIHVSYFVQVSRCFCLPGCVCVCLCVCVCVCLCQHVHLCSCLARGLTLGKMLESYVLTCYLVT